MGLLSVGAVAADTIWSTGIRAEDILAGEELAKLSSRRWAWQFDNGKFEIAVKKSAIPVPAPGCRMEYVILTMPVYYPENPKQAPMDERRAVYDALLRMKKSSRGSMTVRFDALWYARQGPKGPELTTCNIYFTLPLARDAAKISE